MKCNFCGAEIPENETRCGDCGASIEAPADRNISKKVFYKNYATDKVRKEIKSAAILMYIFAGINVILSVVLQGDILSMVDVILMVALGLGIQLAQSRACSIVLLAYSIFNMIYGFISYGKPTGWWIILVAIYATINTFKLQKEYKAFKDSETV